ncbi:PEGA domain-containing protein [Candidatus Daviesbacteria bacterium]|nr:PEGA domain-containing protein [Candidatus Daviesbacteria bacterium]
MRRRFFLTILTLVVIGLAASLAIFLAKGYRLSPNQGGIFGTGILSITSVPDQASVYMDGNLTTATNANINSLPPKTYQVKIIKEGFIPWEKRVEVKEGLVTQIKATLFRAIPSIYPITYTGMSNPSLSPNGQKLVYVVPPPTDGNQLIVKKSGIWIWQLSDRGVTFARGGEPQQIALWDSTVDYTKAKFRFSPDNTQIMVSLEDRILLLDTNKLNDPPKNITVTAQPTIRVWDEEQKTRDNTRLQLIKDLSLRNTASKSAILKWSADESKILYCEKDCQDGLKVSDLDEQKSFDIPKANFYSWLPDSLHIILIDTEDKKDKAENGIRLAKISIVESDGTNKSEIYVGNLDPESVFAWLDSSRLIVVSSLPTPTASQPNLYGINLK